MITNYQTITTLSNEELLFNLESLGYKENETTVEILLHLAEVEQRKLHVAAGYPSLFSYCVQGRLRYSEPAANRRISSARALSQFPELLPLLLSKELTLTTLSLASKILSEGNKELVIAAIRGKTRRSKKGVGPQLRFFRVFCQWLSFTVQFSKNRYWGPTPFFETTDKTSCCDKE